MSRIITLSIVLLIIFAIDLYAYKIFRYHTNSSSSLKYLYWFTTIIFIAGFANMFMRFSAGNSSATLASNLLIGLAFSLFITKLQFVQIFAIEDIIRFIRKIIATDHSFPDRSRIVYYISASLSALLLIFFIYGITIGKYHYKVRTEIINSARIPESFNGFKIVQISDVHAGTFDSKKKVLKGIELINKQDPDLVVFTGDMVNTVAEEAEPYIDIFSQIKAKYGKLSILGNHDYALYAQDKDSKEKRQNVEKLCQIHKSMGFDILLNRTEYIKQANDSIAIAGVENWGLPPFPQFGDLNKAISGIPESTFTVLLSHDPSHWDVEIKQHHQLIDLTLSGHTHGMQFGIYLPWFKWSLVKFKYPKWAGMFEENGRRLYVNIGFGFIGFPGRAGMRPEITVIQLQN